MKRSSTLIVAVTAAFAFAAPALAQDSGTLKKIRDS